MPNCEKNIDVSKVVIAEQDCGPLWDEYVQRHPLATHSHLWGWKQVIENAFGLRTYFLVARNEKGITGILSLVWQHSVLFGSTITSLPFLNGGGPLADARGIEEQLIQYAINIAKEVGAAQMQFRYRGEYSLDLPATTHKVAAVRDLNCDLDAMWKSVSSNSRRKVNKALKSGLTAKVEDASSLGDFYGMFADNMHNLGTPVYDRQFFEQVLTVFPGDTTFVMVRLNEKPVAGALLLSFRNGTEATWMCSDWRFLQMQPNMLLYWWLLRVFAERGFQTLDFGRSSRNSGTHLFKKLWDTRDVNLHWANWSKDGETKRNLSPTNPTFKAASAVWAKLPLSLCNVIGPHIVRNLP